MERTNPMKATKPEVGLEIDPQDPSATEPFPALESQPAFQYNASFHPIDTCAKQAPKATASPSTYTPVTGLRLQTDQLAEKNRQDIGILVNNPIAEIPQQTVFNAGLPVRHSSIRSSHSARTRRTDSLSPGSAVSSPGVGPLADMTPLPSPISVWGSPNTLRGSIDGEVDDATTSARTSSDSSRPPVDVRRLSPRKRKIPFLSKVPSSQEAQIYNANAATHARNRSLSDYIPDGVQAPKSRNVIASTSCAPAVLPQFSPPDDHMHREEHLAVQRGLAIAKPPTPPDSNRGSRIDELERELSDSDPPKVSFPTLYEARMVRSGKLKRWKAIRQLGEGQFSRVMLATSEDLDENAAYDPLQAEANLQSKSLVAIKICEQGPAGGAYEQKLEVSIRREVDILKSIHHPSLVHLKAVGEQERRTLLVLNYCPGGDLFELASSELKLLSPSLIRRIFAELVSAVRHLHLQYIVHRDIKLENILVNLPVNAISEVDDYQTYPSPVVTLTDLGLGKRISKPPDAPLLCRRCGSEDYAAPEVLMGQEYDGRSTDAWALGVVLYSLMEGRMPFDPVPGSRRRSPTSHKIARCEWQWVKWADEDGEWDATKGKELEGAREIVEGLLARTRSRWSLEKVQEREWVSQGIQVGSAFSLSDDED